MRGYRAQRAFLWAGNELRKRPASLIMVARFVPIGRVAVNLTAGATGYPHSRFVGLTVLSAVLWAGYSVGIGLFFGQWFEENHLLGATIAIICAVILGIAVDVVLGRLRRQGPGGAACARTRTGARTGPCRRRRTAKTRTARAARAATRFMVPCA